MNVAVKYRTIEADFLEEKIKALKAETKREIQFYTMEDWGETVKFLLGDCPAKIEAALLMLYFEIKQDPANENVRLARKWLLWALEDILKAQRIALALW